MADETIGTARTLKPEEYACGPGAGFHQLLRLGLNKGSFVSDSSSDS